MVKVYFIRYQMNKAPPYIVNYTTWLIIIRKPIVNSYKRLQVSVEGRGYMQILDLFWIGKKESVDGFLIGSPE
jgi:hypothetical protein